ncbi:MAG: hypothetical protein AB7E79_12285 [Rhodospirillaceae bacterium]
MRSVSAKLSPIFLLMGALAPLCAQEAAPLIDTPANPIPGGYYDDRNVQADHQVEIDSKERERFGLLGSDGNFSSERQASIERPMAIYSSSPSTLSFPITSSEQTNHTFSVPRTISGSATFTIRYRGDYDSRSETADVTVDGISLGTIGGDGSGFQCTREQTRTLTLTESQMRPLIADGRLGVRIQNSSSVGYCNDSERYHIVTVSFDDGAGGGPAPNPPPIAGGGNGSRTSLGTQSNKFLVTGAISTFSILVPNPSVGSVVVAIGMQGDFDAGEMSGEYAEVWAGPAGSMQKLGNHDGGGTQCGSLATREFTVPQTAYIGGLLNIEVRNGTGVNVNLTGCSDLHQIAFFKVGDSNAGTGGGIGNPGIINTNFVTIERAAVGGSNAYAYVTFRKPISVTSWSTRVTPSASTVYFAEVTPIKQPQSINDLALRVIISLGGAVAGSPGLFIDLGEVALQLYDFIQSRQATPSRLRELRVEEQVPGTASGSATFLVRLATTGSVPESNWGLAISGSYSQAANSTPISWTASADLARESAK